MKAIIQFLVLFALWLLLTWSVQTADVVAGIVVSLLTVALMGNIFIEKAERLLNPKRVFWAIIYVPYLLWFILIANMDVAYRVLNPTMPIRPGIIKFKTGLKTDMGKTFLANSITLTPGTLTIDIIGDEFYVHWINIKHDDDPKAQAEEVAGKFERILRRIFE